MSDPSQAEESRANQLRVLEAEINRTQDMIREYLVAAERLLALGSVVLGGGLTIGVTQGHRGVLVALPLPLLALLTYWCRQLVEINAQAGYKWHLEERVNMLLAKNVLHWERLIARQIPRRSITAVFVKGVLLALFAVTWSASIWAAGVIDADPWIWWILFVGLAASVTVLTLGFREASRSIMDAYNLATAAAEEAIRPIGEPSAFGS